MTSSSSAGAPRASVQQLLDEYQQLQVKLADPGIHADQAAARRLGRRYAELTPIVNSSNELAAARGDLIAAREMAAEDPGFAEEAEAISQQVNELETRLGELLTPRAVPIALIEERLREQRSRFSPIVWCMGVAPEVRTAP